MAGMLNQIANKESLHGVMLILQSKMNHHARKLADEYSVKVETFHVSRRKTTMSNLCLFLQIFQVVLGISKAS